MIQFYPSYFIRKYVAQVCAYIHCHEIASRTEVEDIALAICLESLLAAAASETKLPSLALVGELFGDQTNT